MIFRRFIFFAFIFFLGSLLSFSQVHYSDQYADYLLEIKGDTYQVRAVLKNQVENSRRLQLNRNRLRLKAVDLVGNYIVFQNVKLDYPQKEELFDIFVDHSQLHFEAHVEKFKYSSWEQCGASRCIYFTCKKKDFVVNSAEYQLDMNIGEMLQINFDRKRDLNAASRLAAFSAPSIEKAMQMESLFLSGRGALPEEYAELLEILPSSHLQSSLFEEDSLLIGYVNRALELPAPKSSFESLILHRILFTAAPIPEKEQIYKEYQKALNSMHGLWWSLQRFAIDQTDADAFPGWEDATVYDVIACYPLALNYFNMSIREPGSDYTRALELFTIEDFEACERSLKKEINFNGLSPRVMNLIGANFRLMEQADKALPFLLLAYQMNPEMMYVRGNLYLCLASLKYPELEQLESAFLSQNNLDLWSKNQMENLKNTEK
jgi:hypothetical protein